MKSGICFETDLYLFNTVILDYYHLPFTERRPQFMQEPYFIKHKEQASTMA